MLIRVNFYLVATLEMVLVNFLGMHFNVLFDLLLSSHILSPLVLSRCFDTVQVGVLVILVDGSALLDLFCKRCLAIGNLDLVVKSVLFSLKLSQSVLHQQFLQGR